MDLEVGSIYEGKVTGITKFGAFVQIAAGKSGMVHISEVANTFVSDINEYLKVGQAVKVKLIAIDQQGRINLSIKKAMTAEARRPSPGRPIPQLRRPPNRRSRRMPKTCSMLWTRVRFPKATTPLKTSSRLSCRAARAGFPI